MAFMKSLVSGSVGSGSSTSSSPIGGLKLPLYDIEASISLWSPAPLYVVYKMKLGLYHLIKEVHGLRIKPVAL